MESLTVEDGLKFGACLRHEFKPSLAEGPGFSIPSCPGCEKEKKLLSKTPTYKLDIGSGENRRDTDYLTVDFYHPNGDIKAQMWDIPVKECSVTDIWAEHCLEHIGYAQVHPTLKEWLRILKVGGRAIISVPNFDYVAKYWLCGPDRPWAEAMVFGNQAHAGEFHKCAFTPATLKADCEAAGFKVQHVNIRWTHSQETIQAVCTKELKIEKIGEK